MIGCYGQFHKVFRKKKRADYGLMLGPGIMINAKGLEKVDRRAGRTAGKEPDRLYKSRQCCQVTIESAWVLFSR